MEGGRGRERVVRQSVFTEPICRTSTSVCQTIHPPSCRAPLSILPLQNAPRTSSSTTECDSPWLLARFLVGYLVVDGPLKIASAPAWVCTKQGNTPVHRQLGRQSKYRQTRLRGCGRLSRSVSNCKLAVLLCAPKLPCPLSCCPIYSLSVCGPDEHEQQHPFSLRLLRRIREHPQLAKL